MPGTLDATWTQLVGFWWRHITAFLVALFLIAVEILAGAWLLWAIFFAD